MPIKSLSKALPKDPDNPGWVLGWAVVRSAPWSFIDIYASKEVAEVEAARLGDGYSAEYGSHHLGSDDFVSFG
ncbi:hypothetical protein [Azorhizophilus paspali]|uniref:Uncharacterized protein n=1 Tax=Azorhizophilus paspali TaxID=69963 RepID=A0ABV6SQW3_AZOPA